MTSWSGAWKISWRTCTRQQESAPEKWKTRALKSRVDPPLNSNILARSSNGSNDKYCKHVAATEMYRESQVLLDNARSMVLITSLEGSLEDQLADLY